MGDWIKIAIEDLAHKETGHMSFVDGDWIESEHIINEGIRIIQTGNIGIGKYLDKPGNKKFISDKSFNQLKCKNVFPGDILICRLAEPIGRACIVPNNEEYYVTAVDVIIFRPSEKYSKEFLLYCLNDERILKLVNDQSGGSTRQRISRTNYGKLELRIPKSKSEQATIATILSTIDQAIEKTEQLIAKYERIKNGLMQDLLTRGIDEQGNIRSEETHAFKDSVLGRIPREWEVKYLKEICGYQNGKSFPSNLYGKSGIRLVKPGNLEAGGFVNLFNKHATFIPYFFWEDSPSYRVFGGELLMNLTAQSLEDQFLGRVCITPENTKCLLNQRIARIIPHSVDRDFLYWQFKGKYFRHHVDLAPKGTKVKHLYNNDLDTALIPLPKSQKEQKKIADVLWMQDYTIRKMKTDLSKMRAIKKGLMQDLLIGKVRVNPLIQQKSIGTF